MKAAIMNQVMAAILNVSWLVNKVKIYLGKYYNYNSTCLFVRPPVVSAVYFAPYLTGLSSMVPTRAAKARRK